MSIKSGNLTASRRTDGVFPRAELARQLAERLLGRDPLFNYGRSGLFLAGPRRTGKSTFLEHDLVPQIEHFGALPIYVDLWSKPGTDPAELVSEAVREALRSAAGVAGSVRRALRRVRRVNLKARVTGFQAEFGVEIDSVGRKSGASLSRALKALSECTGKVVVLIIDEVQHALTSPAGVEALFALKSARDALNLGAPATPRLVVLGTGSVRSKISALVLKKGEAFYGAAVADFPLLDAGFVEFALRTRLAHVRPEARPTLRGAVRAFELVGYRPEDFDLILQRAVISGRPLGGALIESAIRRRVELLNEIRRQLAVLTPLQRAVLRRMVGEEPRFAPFSAESLAFYARCCGRRRRSGPFTNGDVQRALDALERKFRLVWRSARGAYELDDRMVGEVVSEERLAEDMELLIKSEPERLSPEQLREWGFFQDIPESEWPDWGS